MPEKRWVYKNIGRNKDEILAMSEKLSISPVILTILLNRGIEDEAEIKTFLSKSIQVVHNPFELPDMEEATNTIIDSIEKKEKICIYGDYDVDGVTATAIMYRYLKEHGADVDYFIPNRFEDGYGINVRAINKISKTGCRLIITVDCGITSIGEVELAKAQGMKMVITDHHSCIERLPNAEAVVNPKRADSEYPFTDLCGAGIALKTILALAVKFKESAKEVLFKYAPYAAIGTVADVVSLVDENRAIVDKGLASLGNKQYIGIEALIKVAGIKDINSQAISFGIAPRINASGRMSNAKKAVELLLENDPAKAKEIAEELNADNDRRREIEQEIFEEALEKCKSIPNLENKKVIVLAGEDWHEGVIGIVASRICEMFYKPVIMLSYSGDIAKGSCRSIEGFNLFEALTDSEELLEKFGGHAMAAGLTISMQKLAEFDKKINAYAESILSAEQFIPKLLLDCKVSPNSLTLAKVASLNALEPFGAGNEVPIFSISGAEIQTIMQIGEAKNHLKIQIRKGENGFSCIAFRMGDFYNRLKAGDKIDIAFTPEINTYNNYQSVQLRLCDIKKI